jgi:hypothetical protein
MTELDLTAGGKLTVDPRVNPLKVQAMAEMVKGAKLGGYAGERARLDIAESLTTSDAPFAFAHLTNLRNLPQYAEYIPDFAPIVTDETVPDFRPMTFFNLTVNSQTLTGLENGKDNDGKRIAPVVAEGDTYQYAFGYTQSSTSVAVKKRGFKIGWTLEQAVNDVYNLVQKFPGDMLVVGQKTDEYVVFRALTQGVTSTSRQQAEVDFVSGVSVPINSPFSAAAIRVGMRQVGRRVDQNGNRVPIPGKYYLVVALNTSESINWEFNLARSLTEITNGAITTAPNTTADPLNRIAGIIESPWITDNSWYLVPANGTVEKPALIRVALQGYTSPEVYVSNFNGTPLGGGASGSPFTAFGFDNDSVDLKFRQFTNAVLFSEDAIIWSNGTGV